MNGCEFYSSTKIVRIVLIFIDPKKLLIEHAAILYVAIMKSGTRCRKKKLFNPSRRSFSQQFRISRSTESTECSNFGFKQEDRKKVISE